MLYASVYYNVEKVSNTLHYAGPFLLSKQSQQTRFLFDGGYYVVRPPGAVYQPHFYYYAYDHLGSIRCAVYTTGIGSERGDYYPDGTLISDLSWPGSYKYNGKEFDNLYRLNWLDYGARQYMPDLGQWTSVDPLAEKYYHISPYAFCANNPMRYSPSGVPYTTYTKTMLPPYGDDPRDQKWIKLGIDYWKRNY